MNFIICVYGYAFIDLGTMKDFSCIFKILKVINSFELSVATEFAGAWENLLFLAHTTQSILP